MSWIMPANGASYHASSVLRPSASMVHTTTSQLPSLPSPPASYAKQTISPVSGSNLGCAVNVGAATWPSKSYRPSVSSVTGSRAKGGPSSLDASSIPRQKVTLVLLAVRTTPRTASLSVHGLR